MLILLLSRTLTGLLLIAPTVLAQNATLRPAAPEHARQVAVFQQELNTEY
ncbi:hypothetical protein [Hymenobacter swuensis]|uniref:Uncharacterized protein n=1 Tax=Hymenobacter swuensis DY53 TaxID=1227739 RepID=W8ERP0_9BACT|nr:hypothetical protein [Hymenobacter swuensis]AHJ95824.1 hypothetical protein Hsw_0229 [Hymenobacter swuensis DY53]